MDWKWLLNEVNSIAPDIIAMRRDLHAMPELGGAEKHTRAYIINKLNQYDIKYTEFDDHYGVIGLIEGNEIKGNAINKNQRTIGLRADMDALPIEESLNNYSKAQQKEIGGFISKNEGVMHACGHDAHMAILLGAAGILNKYRDKLNGTVKLLFEPMEETIGGAKLMIRDGCMENPKVDAVIALHMHPDSEAGNVYIKRGITSGASDDINIMIKGRGAHGAYPERGTDSIVIAAQIILALQTLISRETSPLDSAVLSLGTIQGGTAGNIICDKVNIKGTLRTLNEDTKKRLKQRIIELVGGMAKSLGGEGEVSFHDGYEPVYNHKDLYDDLMKIMHDMHRQDKVIIRERPSMGVESFGFFAKEAKGLYYDLGCGIGPALHSMNFWIDESCLAMGTALQAAMAFAYLA